MAETRIVRLPWPIERGGETVAEIALREPTAGQLRGLRLKDVLELEARAMIALIPRLCEPALSEEEVAALRPANLMALAGEVVLFFAGPEDRAQAGLG